jgi:transcriptional regulator with XRE-family HTH domain
VTAQPAPSASIPARVPASTIRAIRRMHALEREDFAQMFKVTVRTVFRWERDGVDPAILQLDPGAKSGPEWRRNLLTWLLGRLEATRVTDTRKKQGETA